jgi:hypothetical protein
MKYLLLALFLSSLSCNTVDIENEKEQILNQIDLVRQAHFEKNAHKFLQPNADTWIDIRNGQIQEVNKTDRIASTQQYLNNMEFIQLETLGEPVIEISNDASLATFSSRVLLRGKLSGEPIVWIVAWQNVLRKIDDEWKIVNSVNTEANAQVSAEVILNEVRKNLGAVSSVNSISALANCTGPEGNSFKTLIYSQQNEGRMEQLSKEHHSIFKHGTNSWSKNVVSGVVYDSLNTGLQVFTKSHELHWLSLFPENRYTRPTYHGIVIFKNEKAFKIRFTDDSGNPVNFYYNFENYLPLAFDIVIDDQGNSVTTYFENWEEKDGLKLFKNATFDQGGLLFKYEYTDINVNTLDENDFRNQEVVISQ